MKYIKNNLNKYHLILILFGTLLVPSIALAQEFTFFTIQDTDNDVAYRFLSRIFGDISYLNGRSDLLATIFKTYNHIVLTLGTIIVAYTLTISLVNTAQEGEIMGRKWSSLWIPFRAILGYGLIIPGSSGYSVIQLITMNIILQGSAIGNQVWDIIADYSNDNANNQSNQQNITDEDKSRGWFYAGTHYFDLKLNRIENNPEAQLSEKFDTGVRKGCTLECSGSSRSNCTLTCEDGNKVACEIECGDDEDTVYCREYLCKKIKKDKQKDENKLGENCNPLCKAIKKTLGIGAPCNNDIFSIVTAPIAKAYDLVRSYFDDMKDRIIEDILNVDGDPLDPLEAMREVGRFILELVENIFYVFIVFTLLLMLLTCTGTFASPFCFVTGGALSFLAPFFMFCMVTLYVSGTVFMIYIPMIPYIVFTFAAVGWLLLCIEAMVATPIFALGVISPSHDLLGRASPSVVIITNIFLRPSLILVGFIAASRLLLAINHILMETFLVTLDSSLTQDYAIFAIIAILAIFVSFTTALYHKAFSLTYLIPDKISRWIGGQAEQSGIDKALQQARTATESGAKSAQGVMKGGFEAAGKVGKRGVGKSGGGKEAYSQFKSGVGRGASKVKSGFNKAKNKLSGLFGGNK